jgi:high-affinity iron transporter
MQGVFIGTFLIGLREGLEATLIVSIVGAFLKRNGHSTRPMFVGVALAVLISVAVGVGLDLLSATLPQARQEMLETVISAIAVVFVTSMIIWMNRNAARLRGALEHEAQQALNRGGALALVGMAFLAVLKEGFETSVFLLAAAETSNGNRWFAVFGGALGIAASIGLGVGLYLGGLKLNLARFFRITGVFLVLIAAGLVMGALRTEHEAGWVTIGQRQLFNLLPWMPSSSVQGALITGVFGIPADPRLIEGLGWLLYVLPVLVVFLWPARLAAVPRTRSRLLAATSAALLIVAALLAIVVPAGGSAGAPARSVTDHTGLAATVALTSGSHGCALDISADGAANVRSVALTAVGDESVDGITVRVWEARVGADPGGGAPTISLQELLSLNGNRLPIGLTAARTPGPFQAQWTADITYTVRAHGDSVVSAQAVSNRTAVLSGGGLAAPKTVSIGGLPTDWSTVTTEDQSTAAQIAANDRTRVERQLWKVWLPLVMAAFGVSCGVGAIISGRGGRTGAERERKSTDGQSHRPGQVPVP